jgi:hypothetical protein
MKATLLLNIRQAIAANAFVQLKIWKVPRPVPGSAHDLKHSLAFVVAGQCVLRYDNERGKGDHRHADGKEAPYAFTTPAQLLADFWVDVDQRRPK